MGNSKVLGAGCKGLKHLVGSWQLADKKFLQGVREGIIQNSALRLHESICNYEKQGFFFKIKKQVFLKAQ
jgi:hypothetical protein